MLKKKKKRETEIDHLKNGETTAIARLLKEYNKYEKDGDEAGMRACLKDIKIAVDIYSAVHKRGDNPTFDSMVERLKIQTEYKENE